MELGRVREEERKKIADHLHDQIGQNLVLAKMRLNLLKSEAAGKQRDVISAISDLLDQTIKDTRSLIQELHVEWLADLDPKEALLWLLDQLQTKYSLHCVTGVIAFPKSLAKDVQEVLLQAVRELLVNVAKHAGVDTVRITCESEKGWIRIRVVDDGRGFGVPSGPGRSAKGGFGLTIVRARLGQLGGNLYIESRVGMGTRATIILPCA
jgi:signal transduction histidine kinase